MQSRALRLLMLALFALAAASAAQAYNRKAAKANDDGLAALKASDWAGARKAFEEALSLDDQEGRIRVQGVKYADYYPSLGLAEAALELGDVEAARSALERYSRIGSPGAEQVAIAASLQKRLSAGAAPSAEAKPASSGTPAPAADALAAKQALDAGDLATARRKARSVPTDPLAQNVLAAVDVLLAEKLTAARSDQQVGALAAAKEKLDSVLVADPGNSAAKSLLESVKADASSAASQLTDARVAFAAGRLDEAEDLARQARGRDAGLSAEASALEREVSTKRRAPVATAGGDGSTRRADASKILAGARSSLDAGDLADARRKASDALAGDAGMSAEVTALQAEIARQADEADDALRRARAAAGSGRFVEARQLATQAERLDKAMEGEASSVRTSVDEGDAKAERLLAKIEAHVETGASESARSAVAELAAAFPEHPELPALRAEVEGSGELVAGIRAYFRADWAASIETLTPLIEKSAQRSDLLAVLGCAHATRGLLLGKDDAEGKKDLERARELFGRSLAANPDMQLDPRYFSPRLRALFDQARGG